MVCHNKDSCGNLCACVYLQAFRERWPGKPCVGEVDVRAKDRIFRVENAMNSKGDYCNNFQHRYHSLMLLYAAPWNMLFCLYMYFICSALVLKYFYDQIDC